MRRDIGDLVHLSNNRVPTKDNDPISHSVFEIVAVDQESKMCVIKSMPRIRSMYSLRKNNSYQVSPESVSTMESYLWIHMDYLELIDVRNKKII